MDISRVHQHRVLRDQLLSRHHAFRAQPREHPLTLGSDVRFRVARKPELDVHAQPRALENIVVEADPVERELSRRVIHPVHVARPFAVETEVEHQHLVPGKHRRIVRHARQLQQAREGGGGDEPVVLVLAVWRRRDLRWR